MDQKDHSLPLSEYYAREGQLKDCLGEGSGLTPPIPGGEQPEVIEHQPPQASGAPDMALQPGGFGNMPPQPPVTMQQQPPQESGAPDAVSQPGGFNGMPRQQVVPGQQAPLQPPQMQSGPSANCAGTVAGLAESYDPSSGSGFLALRAGPTGQAAQLRELFNGDAVAVVGKSGNWLHVTAADGTSGWVFRKYITMPQNCMPGSVMRQ